MAWVDETAEAVHEAIGEVFPEQVLAVAAIDGDAAVATAWPPAFAARPFETGSIGKTHTATLLGLAVVDRRVALDDPIGRWLDAGANGDITLAQLATHTSGLPQLAPNHDAWDGFDPRDPYRGYAAEHAEEALREVERLPTTVAYSNFGYQVLGLALERIADRPFAELVRDEVFLPLGMPGSAVTGSSSDPVPGFDESARPTPAWVDLLAGPGGCESPVADMAAYVRAVLDPPAGRLGEAMRLAIEPRTSYAGAQVSVGLAWHHSASGLVWHNGGTGGFSSMLAVDPATGRGVVGLVNTAIDTGLDQAVASAAGGGDPRDHRRPPVDADVVDEALAVVDLMIADDTGAVRSRASAELAALLADDALREGWRAHGVDPETVGRRTVAATFASRYGATVVVAVEHAGGTAEVELVLADDRTVLGLRFR